MTDPLLALLSQAIPDYQPTSEWAKTKPLTAADLRAALERPLPPPCGSRDRPHVFHPQEIERARTDLDTCACCAHCGRLVGLGALLRGPT